jgi:hypothetical protein
VVQISDRDLGTPQPDLQADREQRAVAQAGDGYSAGASRILRVCALANAKVAGNVGAANPVIQ